MPTLEEAVLAFELWRSQRKSKAERIPDALWTMVQELVPHYKKVTIQKALRLSGGQFNQRCLKKVSVHDALPLSAPSGFAIGVLSPERSLSEELCELTLKGAHKSLQIKVPMRHAGSMLFLLEGYL